MVFADSSEMSLSIRNAVRHLKQLGKYDLNENIFQCYYFYKKKANHFTQIYLLTTMLIISIMSRIHLWPW